MAIWQVSIKLTSLELFDKESNSKFFDSSKLLADTFPRERSWCNSIIQYGKLDSTCVEIYCDKKRFTVLVRIDLRTITKAQLLKIVEFACKNNLLVKYKKRKYKPSVDIFIRIIRESDANRFLLEPEKYLESMIENE